MKNIIENCGKLIMVESLLIDSLIEKEAELFDWSNGGFSEFDCDKLHDIQISKISEYMKLYPDCIGININASIGEKYIYKISELDRIYNFHFNFVISKYSLEVEEKIITPRPVGYDYYDSFYTWYSELIDILKKYDYIVINWS